MLKTNFCSTTNVNARIQIRGAKLENPKSTQPQTRKSIVIHIHHWSLEAQAITV